MGYGKVENDIEDLLWRGGGLVRSASVVRRGVSSAWLRVNGLVRYGRGVYGRHDHHLRPFHRLEVVSLQRRHPVFGGLTALWLHGLLGCEPESVWLVIAAGAHRPIAQAQPIPWTIIRSRSLSTDLQQVDTGEHRFTVHTLARALVDCARLNTLVGSRITVELVRRALHQGLESTSLRECGARLRALGAVTACLEQVQTLPPLEPETLLLPEPWMRDTFLSAQFIARWRRLPEVDRRRLRADLKRIRVEH